MKTKKKPVTTQNLTQTPAHKRFRRIWPWERGNIGQTILEEQAVKRSS